MYCKASETCERSEIPMTVGATIARLSPEEEQDFLVRRIHLEAGGSMPHHTNKIQHQQFVLSGEATVGIGEETYHAKAGDFLYIPAGVIHYYEASYGSDYQFLCMITTAEDEIVMVDA